MTFMLLTEIKPKTGTIPDIQVMSIPGYDLLTSDLSSPNTRGVTIYIRTKSRQVTLKTQPPTDTTKPL